MTERERVDDNKRAALLVMLKGLRRLRLSVG